MAKNKTKATERSVTEFINSVDSEQKRNDSFELVKLFERLTGEKAVMWGSSIIGFGTYHYKYESGREGDFMQIGFSPRKAKFSLYIMSGFSKFDHYLENLGKFKTGKSCLYVNKIADIDMEILEEMAKDSIAAIKKKYQ